MSIIAGMARLDGAPMSAMGATGAGALPRLAARMASRAPDGVTTWCGDHAGMVHGALFNTPESRQEPQPRRCGALTISFDGRLDNRADLIARLDCGPDTGDAALALHAFVKWREAAAEHLLGDFAFAVWDADARTLSAARSTSGVRPFLYREGRGWIAWASELDLLAAGVDVMPPPNEGMAAEYLAGVIASKTDTLFAGIFRLPPAHVLTASASGVRVRRYWSPQPRAELRYRRDADYEEHLTDILGSAVRARLRTGAPAGVMLSGGIDSSAVTALAALACRERTVPCPGVRAFSISLPGSSDEREYFEAMAAAAGISGERFVAQSPLPGQFREEIARDLDIQTFPHAPTSDPLRAAARDRGVRVMLTGQGGDDWLGSGPAALADLLRQGRLTTLVQRMRRECADDGLLDWPGAVKAAVWPLVPFGLQQLVRAMLRRGQPPAWIDPAFAARVHLLDRLALGRPEVDFRRREDRNIWREGTSGTMVHAMEATSRSGSHFGLEHSMPYLDRRIVEFGLSLPADQRWRDGRGKDLLRRAMAAHVPALIARRVDNPAADHVYIQALGAERPGGGEEARRSTAEQLGWVRQDQSRALRTQAETLYQSGNAEFAWPAWAAWLVRAMDLWLDAVTVVQ